MVCASWLAPSKDLEGRALSSQRKPFGGREFGVDGGGMSCGEWRWVFERDIRLLLSSATPSDFQLTCHHRHQHQHLQLQQLISSSANRPWPKLKNSEKRYSKGCFKPQQTENRCYKSVAGTVVIKTQSKTERRFATF